MTELWDKYQMSRQYNFEESKLSVQEIPLTRIARFVEIEPHPKRLNQMEKE